MLSLGATARKEPENQEDYHPKVHLFSKAFFETAKRFSFDCRCLLLRALSERHAGMTSATCVGPLLLQTCHKACLRQHKACCDDAGRCVSPGAKDVKE